MSALVLSGDMPNCVFGLEGRNFAAQRLITSYAKKHAAMDVGIGAAGLIPIPGAATAALIGAIAAQAPVISEPMARELATIYNSSIDGQTRKMVAETIEIGALADLGIEFLKEIVTELFSDLAACTILTAIPYIGSVAAAALDATIAATLTWRVGTMSRLITRMVERGFRTASIHMNWPKQLWTATLPRLRTGLI